MFSDTLDNDKFNIPLLEKDLYLNFSWNDGHAKMSLYREYDLLESFSFDNELFLDYYINMYFSEDFFLKAEGDKALREGKYKKEYIKKSVLESEYMNKAYNLHFQDMNENDLYIICTNEDIQEPYKMYMNETKFEIDSLIIRKIRFVLGYIATAQFHYEKRTLIV